VLEQQSTTGRDAGYLAYDHQQRPDCRIITSEPIAKPYTRAIVQGENDGRVFVHLRWRAGKKWGEANFARTLANIVS